MQEKNIEADLSIAREEPSAGKSSAGLALKKEPNPEAFTVRNIMTFDLYMYLGESIIFYKDNPIALKKELLSGITVAVMQVPEVHSLSARAARTVFVVCIRTDFPAIARVLARRALPSVLWRAWIPSSACTPLFSWVSSSGVRYP